MHSIKNKKEVSTYEGDTVKISYLPVSMEKVSDSSFSKHALKTHARPNDNCFIIDSTPSKHLATNLQNIQKQRKRASHKKAFKCNWNLEEVISYHIKISYQ